uniref:EF-hand domain-containing protein n=1 Tax=Globodera pallida TaxID=36090 RepID=A0A183BQ95_GLOPA
MCVLSFFGLYEVELNGLVYDIVLERQEASASPVERHSHMALLQNGIKLIELVFANRTDSSSSRHNFRLFSPRFMPLMPDKSGLQHNNSVLSPTLLAMYDEHDNKSIGNVPEMLRKAGVGERERLELIETMMDITGTTAKVDHTLEMFKELNLFNEGNYGTFWLLNCLCKV